jgi:hypothetical protein|tara:strand:- start:724 stop:939 length:216 start_codon:yes stop_codon:yes gene_type:complete
MKKLLLVFSIIASFGIVVTASTITYSETTANAAASINSQNGDGDQEKRKKKDSEKVENSSLIKACCSNTKK